MISYKEALKISKRPQRWLEGQLHAGKIRYTLINKGSRMIYHIDEESLRNALGKATSVKKVRNCRIYQSTRKAQKRVIEEQPPKLQLFSRARHMAELVQEAHEAGLSLTEYQLVLQEMN